MKCDPFPGSFNFNSLRFTQDKHLKLIQLHFFPDNWDIVHVSGAFNHLRTTKWCAFVWQMYPASSACEALWNRCWWEWQSTELCLKGWQIQLFCSAESELPSPCTEAGSVWRCTAGHRSSNRGQPQCWTLEDHLSPVCSAQQQPGGSSTVASPTLQNCSPVEKGEVLLVYTFICHYPHWSFVINAIKSLSGWSQTM